MFIKLKSPLFVTYHLPEIYSFYIKFGMALVWLACENSQHFAMLPVFFLKKMASYPDLGSADWVKHISNPGLEINFFVREPAGD